MASETRILSNTRRPASRPWRRSWGIVTLVGIVAVLAVGAGAAAGSAMSSGSGMVEGSTTASVGQALMAGKAIPVNLPSDRRFFSSVADDGTKFSVALELIRGETVSVIVPITNRSKGDTVADFAVVMPQVPSLNEGVPGLSLQTNGSGVINDVVSLGPNHWTFTVKGGAAGGQANPVDGLKLTFNVSPTAMAGYFNVTGSIRTEEY